MTIRWPRWIGFLSVSVLLTWGLGLLQPDTERLASRTWSGVAGDLSRTELYTEHSRANLWPASALEVDGGTACEQAVRAATSTVASTPAPPAASWCNAACPARRPP
jgi:hypothetical protein